ncbi:MAG: potassium-transporting ATPase subunit C [Chlorobiaceae bacterium]|nr:potassium-transporting ATPase subunit C [Chlorobiaceae bacterium]
MKTTLSFGDITRQLAVSLRLLPITVVICSGLYTVIILLAGQVVPYSSSGSLIRSEKGEVVGSDLIGQQFKQPKYFWPRPSAVSWNAASAGASNISPASLAMRQKTEKLLPPFALKKGEKIPADLVTASGSGLDPHISFAAARFQVPRVAQARGLSIDQVMAVINSPGSGKSSIPLLNESVINVLQLNRSLDRLQK